MLNQNSKPRTDSLSMLVRKKKKSVHGKKYFLEITWLKKFLILSKKIVTGEQSVFKGAKCVEE